MGDEYDFSEAVKSPYTDQTKSAITLQFWAKQLEYFNQLSDKLDIPYKTLIGLCLSDCVVRT